MNFIDMETQKFYLDMCNKYKIKFIIYLEKDEKVTKDMIIECVKNFLFAKERMM